MSKTSAADDEIEDCPELNDEYFAQVLMQSFTVVDVWDDKEDGSVVVKNEPESIDSKSSRSESKPGSTSNSRKKHNSRSDRRSKSPESSNADSRNRSDRRSKSPDRSRLKRASPPRPVRRPSPVGSNRDRATATERFLKELQEKFAKEGQQAPEVEKMLKQQNRRHSIDTSRQYRNHFNNKNNNSGSQLARQFHFMNNSQMMPQQQMPYNQMMMNPMVIQQQQQQSMMMNNPYQMMAPVFNQFDPFQNMPMQQAPPLMSIPQPVPPPTIQSAVQISPPMPTTSTSSIVPEKETTGQNVKKKTKINLTDFLRQKSKQRSKADSLSDANTTAKKAEVLKRCKSASNMISELEKQKNRIPLTCVLSNITLPSLTSNRELSNKSPLIANDNNLLFKFQATTSQCRKAIEYDPIKNISGSVLPLARNLKMDMLALSEKVDKEAKILPVDSEQQPHQPSLPSSVMSSQTIVVQQPKQIVSTIGKKKNLTKFTQTLSYDCKVCEKQQQAKKEAKTVSVQTRRPLSHAAGTQYEDDGNNFSFTIDAKTLENRTFEQHHALQVFSSAFRIPCKFLDSRPTHRDDDGKFVGRKHEDFLDKNNEDDARLNFANPENPNPNKRSFISLSPVRETRRRPSSPRRRPSSPKRSNIFNRVGEKIREPPHRSFDLFRDHSPPRLDTINATRYEVPSPPRRRMTPIHNSLNSPPINRFRNRSRSRSRSRECPSPPRHRSRHFDLNERRGRY